MSASLATTVVEQVGLVRFNDEQLALLRTSFGASQQDPLSNSELAYFAQVCTRTQLDPFRRQIYAIKRGGRMSIQVGIDGMRAIAVRSGHYEGQTPVQWCGDDGKWTDVWLSSKPPAAAKVGVYRRGFREPLWAVARYASYAQDNLWRKMPEVMIAKCAEALALRKAFPEDISGLYSDDEMGQADNDQDVRIAGAPPPASSDHATPQRVMKSAADSRERPALTPEHDPETGELETAASIRANAVAANLELFEQRKRELLACGTMSAWNTVKRLVVDNGRKGRLTLEQMGELSTLAAEQKKRIEEPPPPQPVEEILGEDEVPF